MISSHVVRKNGVYRPGNNGTYSPHWTPALLAWLIRLRTVIYSQRPSVPPLWQQVSCAFMVLLACWPRGCRRSWQRMGLTWLQARPGLGSVSPLRRKTRSSVRKRLKVSLATLVVTVVFKYLSRQIHRALVDSEGPVFTTTTVCSVRSCRFIRMSRILFRTSPPEKGVGMIWGRH